MHFACLPFSLGLEVFYLEAIERFIDVLFWFSTPG
jgi:hypothetical protein